jgi:D-alanine-D-alanine ligase
MSAAMKIAVLHGKVPPDAGKDELDVLVQVEAVSGALADLGYEPVVVPFSTDLKAVIEALAAIRPAFAFNLVESVEGQGRLIHTAPALLDYLRLPYTGASTEAIFLTSNKILAKKLLKSAGIPTPPWLTPETLPEEGLALKVPYIIKSVWEHASIGLDEDSVVLPVRPSRLGQAMESQCDRLGGECFAEAYVEGREFNLSLLSSESGPEVLPPAEISFADFPAGKLRLVAYRAKWDAASFEYRHTLRSFAFGKEDASLLKRLEATARDCWRLFGLRGYARVDFRVDEQGNPWVLEINANPCLSPDAGFAATAERVGLGFDQVVARIVAEPAAASAALPGRRERRLGSKR